MAYDRYETRDAPRDERARWTSERYASRDWERGPRQDRGLFERVGDETAWTGDDDLERRRREDRLLRDEREGRYGREYDRGFARERDRLPPARSIEREYYSPSRREAWDLRERDIERSRFSRPTADFEPLYASAGYGGERGFGDFERSPEPFSRDEFRRTGLAGTFEPSRDLDPHYRSWRQRHMGELDRDYEDYRRESQTRFENAFTNWRERRQQKRGLLGQVHEHMEVVGNDAQHVGTIDRVAGDRIILTKSDPESGGVHHSLSCSHIEQIEGDRVVLDGSAEEARKRWRDEGRNHALFEREERGEFGPRILERGLEGAAH